MPEYRQFVSEAAAENINKWLSEPKYAEYVDEINELIDNQQWQTLEDSFFKILEFGTGGRRGTTGVGSNRTHRVTIGESAQALCKYATCFDADAPKKGIVIACDTRLSSPELSRYAATVCAGNGYKTYIFESFRSTPELSFALRHLGCAAGIVISASHNPPLDNGFKAYWSDGSQLVAPHDKGVMATAAEITTIRSLRNYDDAVRDGSIIEIGEEVDSSYIAAVLKESEGKARDLKIAYSPLHGAGQRNTLPVLKQAGFTDIILETDQMIPDGHFPTVDNGKPNPEEKAANDRVVALMLAQDADIAITNDPDADRIGVMVRQQDDAIYLNGNQSAVLAAEYVLRKKHERGDLTPQHYVAKTIVTTDMLQAVADHYGVTLYGNMLIGFKYIGELIHKKESTNEIFVIGGEESYGLLKGTYARDKDGAVGALSLAEFAAELKAEGKTLWDELMELYTRYGMYLERLDTVICPGADGFKEMQAIMAAFRDQAPTEIDGHKVTAVLDYQTLERKDIITGEKTTIDCVSGNVLVFEFGDARRRITVRPSGTEPKLKFYIQWWQESSRPVAEYDQLAQSLENISRELEGMALSRVES